MTTPQPPTRQKFLFDRSFDGLQPDDAGAQKIEPTFSQAQLDEARQAAYAEGHAAAEQASIKTQTAAVLTAAQQIERHLERLLDQAAKDSAEQKADIMAIALTIAHKLLPDFAAQHGFGEIQSLVNRALEAMAREPRLVIRVHDELLDSLKIALESITTRHAYAGKIVLLADDMLGHYDCKIEWADGGMERDANLIWQEIDRAVAQAKGTATASSGAPSATVPESTTDVAV
ncbi:MAG: FliH/SctL family protein [Alphaproteobacteria bacterium]